MITTLLFYVKLSFTFLILILCLISCEQDSGAEPEPQPDDDDVTFNQIGSVPELLPYQVVEFGNNTFPGTKEDYQVFFGETDIPIDEVTTASLKVIVPFDIELGEKDLRLLYKQKEYKIGKVKIMDWANLSPADISFFETGDPEHPIQMLDSMQNKIIPHIEDGILDKVYFQSGDGANAVIELNEMGLPSMIYSGTDAVMIDGYDLEKGTANLAMFKSDNFEDASYLYGIQLDVDELNHLASLRSSMSGRVGSGGRTNSEITQVIDVVGTVFSITGCIVSLTPPFTPLGATVGALNCASAVYSAYKLFKPDGGHEGVDVVNSVFSATSAIGNCAMLATKPKDAKALYDGLYGCYQLVLEGVKGIDFLYDEAKRSAERALEKHRAMLTTGYGDIKISLAWDNGADLDLWVVEPSGEKIYYEHTTSATQGQLDLDDTNGFGPENVFWPVDKAPFGNYQVQVHFYGDEDDGPANYQVTIFNFGKMKVFSGTVSYNQVATVSVFESNGWVNDLGRIGGRVAAPIVVMADRSSLPMKK